MNINQLAIFHAVAQTNSVTRAAERLHISQPAVSKQLRELERSLNTALFHRLSKGVRLTDSGELLAGYATRIFELESEAETALAQLRRLERGRLRVGASTTIGVYLLPAICAEFKAKYPGIELNLEIDNTREIQRRMEKNEFDLALAEGLEENNALQPEVFLTDEIVAIAAPQHPLLSVENLNVEMLCTHPMILRESGSGTRAVVERALAQQGLTIQVAMSLGSTEAIKRAVAAGLGIALVSKLTIENEIASGALHVLCVRDFSFKRPLQRLRVRGKYEGRAAREFLRLLRESVAPENAKD